MYRVSPVTGWCVSEESQSAPSRFRNTVLLRFKTQKPFNPGGSHTLHIQTAPCGPAALGTSGLEGPGRLRP